MSSAAIYVVGHKNPDTDSVASAIGYAWLHRERDGENAIAARAGTPNPQTMFALKHFGVEMPVLLEDASPRFRSIRHDIKPLHPDSPLSEAWSLSAELGRAVPVVERDLSPVGMVTGLSVFRYLSGHLNMADAPFRALIGVPCGEACDRDVPKFNASDRVSDYLSSVLNTEREDFWVVDSNGGYMGTCSRADMLHPPRMQLILVDHNEASQAVSGLAESEVLEVLDHHRLATINTTIPIAFHIDTVGSCSTLVAERMRMARLTPPPGVAGMLLSGMLADTLIFTSPTTTPRDRMSGTWLSWMAFGVDEAEEGLHDYGMQLLRAGADVSGRSSDEIVSADCKSFDVGPIHFSVSQVEVTNFQVLIDRLLEVRKALSRWQEQHNYDFSVLMVTDVIQNNSLLVGVGSNRLLERMPFSRKVEGLWDLPDVVSRKKQLLPTLLGMLQG
ncbi:MAG: DHH family phosphoesterase [Chloroflexi bacterium]|nr:DHH family phosphoesterase [Chloroflexota bacterium]MCL5273950.1 DHH family phosphoesterase [Chloroflexota bacterium]